MRLIRLIDAPLEPWRNGGGWTREIVRSPRDDTGGAFDWRLSVADVDAEGPFSRFDGCDRILVLLSGNGLELDSVGQPVVLRPPFGYLRFPGELPITARPIDGSTADLNLIWRRDRCTVVMREASPASPEILGGEPQEVVVAFSVVTGATRVGDPGEQVTVGSDDREIAFVIAPIRGG